jgi:tetratricopeptide (TPR) repeat protein
MEIRRVVGTAVLSAAILGAQAAAQPTPQELIDGGHFRLLRALVATRNPNDAETVYLKAAIQQLWGNLDEAEKLGEKAVAMDAKDVRFHYRLGMIEGEKARKASLIHALGLARRFKREVDITLTLDPNHIRALHTLVAFNLEAPSIVGGDKAQARVIAERLMKIDPVEGYRALITIAHAEKREDRIEGYVRKAVAERPESYEAHLLLGNWCAEQKKYDEAEREARAAMQVYPDRAAPYTLLAAAMVWQSKWSELDATLGQAEQADAEDFAPYFRAATECLERKVELPRAERYLRKYLTQEAEPRSPSLGMAHWKLGLVLEQEGRKAEAIAELQAAVKLGGSAAVKADLRRVAH